MKNDFKNLAQQTFGDLLVIGRVDNKKIGKKSGTYFLCKCVCGNFTCVISYSLRDGRKHHRCKECFAKANMTHGYSKTRLYQTWCGMRERTMTKHSRGYKFYGAKGIKICDEWLDFLTFRKWALSNGYDDTLTIERLDNSKGYCPENCTWIPPEDQAKNKTNTYLFEIDGEIRSFREWTNLYNRPHVTIYRKVFEHGMSLKEALLSPSAWDTKYRGVSYLKDRDKWLVQFTKNKKKYRVGQFDTKEEAYKAKTEFMKSKGFL